MKSIYTINENRLRENINILYSWIILIENNSQKYKNIKKLIDEINVKIDKQTNYILNNELNFRKYIGYLSENEMKTIKYGLKYPATYLFPKKDYKFKFICKQMDSDRVNLKTDIRELNLYTSLDIKIKNDLKSKYFFSYMENKFNLIDMLHLLCTLDSIICLYSSVTNQYLRKSKVKMFQKLSDISNEFLQKSIYTKWNFRLNNNTCNSFSFMYLLACLNEDEITLSLFLKYEVQLNLIINQLMYLILKNSKTDIKNKDNIDIDILNVSDLNVALNKNTYSYNCCLKLEHILKETYQSFEQYLKRNDKNQKIKLLKFKNHLLNIGIKFES